MNKFVAALLLSVCFITPSIDAQIIGNDPCYGAGDYIGTSGFQGDLPFCSTAFSNLHELYSNEDTRDTVSQNELFLTLSFAGARWDAMFAVMTGNVDTCKMINTLALCTQQAINLTSVNPSADTAPPVHSIPSSMNNLPEDLQCEVFRSNRYAFSFATSETGMNPATIPLEVAAGYRMFEGNSTSVDSLGYSKSFSADSFISYAGSDDVPVDVTIVRRTMFQDPTWSNQRVYEALDVDQAPASTPGDSLVDYDDTAVAGAQPGGNLLDEAAQEAAWVGRGWDAQRRQDAFNNGNFIYTYKVYVTYTGTGTPPNWLAEGLEFHMWRFATLVKEPTSNGMSYVVTKKTHPYLFSGRVSKAWSSPGADKWIYLPAPGDMDANTSVPGTANFQSYKFFTDGIGDRYWKRSGGGEIVRCDNAFRIFKKQQFWFGPSDALKGNLGSE